MHSVHALLTNDHARPSSRLLWVHGRRRWGVEFKRTSAPALTRSLLTAVDTLHLTKAFVVDAGEKTFPLHKQATALNATRLLDDLRA